MDGLSKLLVERTRGEVITPDNPSYDRARSLFNGMLDRRPRLVFRPIDISDLVAAVRSAEELDLPIAVRGGGHSVAGHAMPDGGFVIDLSRWRSATVDPQRQVAEAQGGCLLMDLDVATSAHGLAAPSGTFLDTGIGGLTLGGGISHIVASEGFACDALTSAQLVTADGRIVEVDDATQPDLLWALRGGGGNFGIVTRFRYRLTRIGPMYAGGLVFRGATADVLARLFTLDKDAPDALVLKANVWSEVDGSPIVKVNVAWRGEHEAGEDAIKELTSHPALVEANLRPMSWLQLQALNTPWPHGLRHYWKGHLVREATTGLAEAIASAAENSGDDGFILVELIHGAAHRVPPDSAAFGGRQAIANVTALGIWERSRQDDEVRAWARRAAQLFAPYSLAGGGYLNYAEVDQTAERVAAAFDPNTFERLRAIKRMWDPDNRFRYNANIPPA
ncbi:MAG: FAD-binding oxidoreductase [Chloroflexota bacterium]